MDGCLGGILGLLGIGFLILPFILWGLVSSLRGRVSALEKQVSKLDKRLAASQATAVRPAPHPPAAAPPPPPPSPAIEVPKASPPPSPWPAPKPRLIPALQPSFRWEDFLGVKLFAWLGALLAFLGVAFFVKFSIDNNLVSPPVRVATGCVVGLVSLGIGLRLDRVRFRFLIQALCSAGILMFYGSLFAAFAHYQLIRQEVAFALMALVTATAFVLSVRLNAIAIAVLGLLGGFLTPPLLSTGVDRPLGLFTYVALLDVGLIAVAARKKWTVLLPLAVAGTAFLQLGWVGTFLVVDKVPVGFAIFSFFPALFAGAFLLLRRSGNDDRLAAAAALLPPALSFFFAFTVVGGPLGEAVQRPALLGAFLLAVDLSILVPASLRPRLRAAIPVAGLALFGILAAWINRHLDNSTLPPLLLFVLAFAGLHGLWPTLLERLRPGAPSPAAWSHAFAPLAMVLVLDPILHLTELPAFLWLGILALGAASLLAAWMAGQILGFIAAIVVTTIALAFSILRLPVHAALPPFSLFVIAIFSVLYWIATSSIVKHRPEIRGPSVGALPALSALFPFTVLILACTRLALPDPSPIFGLAAILVVLAMTSTLRHRTDALFGVTMGAVAALELAWHALRFDAAHAVVPAAWYTFFLAVFLIFPFLARRRIEGRGVPWIVAALVGPAQFLLLHHAVTEAAPSVPKGLMALVFGALYVGGLARLNRILAPQAKERSSALASFGGVALLFLTAVIPLQFERQWITMGWALEGMALFWLRRRIAHEGLRIVGLLLLAAVFVRLLPGINPYLLTYAVRGPLPILNWFLYTYGVAAACFFAAAHWIDRARPKILEINARALLSALGTILAFLLVNIEIADFFSAGEQYVVFHFPASLAQDMTYSIAWALFALVLLVIGVRRHGAATRYAGLGLLVITLLKVSLYDLWQLGGLYRVGSLGGLAVILLLVSFLYHQFVAEGTKNPKEA
jgi:hypothetical protein